MFKHKTLFVVGAGASAEFGLPPGKALAEAISRKTDIRFGRGHDPIGKGDMDIYNQLTQGMQRGVDEYQNAGWLIRDGIVLSRSIDDFLDLHRTNPHVIQYGKAAIVKSILEAERGSRLYFGGTSGVEVFSPGGFTDTWLVKLMQMLCPGIPKENVREIFDHVSFIVFNYDRCIEYFLLHGLQKLYGINEDEASDILRDLDIVHPYGAISPVIPFGATSANYVMLSGGIKTYTEQIGDADLTAQVAAAIDRAARIVFLGYAYHSQNMLLLRPPDKTLAKPIFGTGYGMSDSDIEIVSNELASFFKQSLNSHQRAHLIQLENKLKCADLFDYYAKSLTA